MLTDEPFSQTRSPYCDHYRQADLTTAESGVVAGMVFHIYTEREISGMTVKNDPQEIAGLRTLVCVCGVSFVTTKRNVKYCSRACAVRTAEVRRFKREMLNGRHTRQEWNEKLKDFGYLCFWCNCPLVDWNGSLAAEKDHLIPLSRGGTNDISNIVPSCSVCNIRKGSKTAQEYAQQIYTERKRSTLPVANNCFVLRHQIIDLAQKKDLNRI